jgi:hypothetical protein
MKIIFKNILATAIVLVLLFMISSCLKTENPIVYQYGQYPDTVYNMMEHNSEYDDYNVGIYNISADVPLVFSTNRASEGGQFDLEQGIISYAFDQTTGSFWIGLSIINNPFLSNLIGKVNTPRNDFGPYRFYNANEGYEYMILASENEEGNLDMFCTKNLPSFNNASPEILGPYPVNLFNSASNEAYITFNREEDTAYFTSDEGGNFDIYMHTRPSGTKIDTWLNQDYETSTPVVNLNSEADDKCPNLLGNIMIFTSNRPGGLGGYDLYYSVLTNGVWSTPVNLGAPINSEFDEYRPVLGGHTDFTNLFLIFSSNRPGGMGGFDLYFTGIEFDD